MAWRFAQRRLSKVLLTAPDKTLADRIRMVSNEPNAVVYGFVSVSASD
jgi:hypothetical protein